MTRRALRPLLFTLPLLATACGFQPMYGSHSPSGADAAATESGREAETGFSAIKIAVIPDRNGQVLRNDLIDRLNPRGEPSAPKYRLSVDGLNVQMRELDLTKNSEATRAQVVATAQLELKDAQNGTVLLSRQVKSISSYNILPSEFATNVTEANATQNSILDLSRQIELQLSLYFNR